MKSNNNSLKFGNAAELVEEKVNPSSISGTRYIGLKHVEPYTLILSSHGYAEDVTSPKTVIKKGDILFGKLRPYFRKVIRAPFDGICSTEFWVVRAKKNIDQTFLYYWMASQEFVNAASKGVEGTAMPSVKFEFVERFETLITKKKEQVAIGEVLRPLDEKVQLNMKMCVTLEKTISTLFKSWFIEFDPVKSKVESNKFGICSDLNELFPDKFESTKFGRIPKGWNVSEIGKLVETVGGATPSKQDSSFWNGKHNWVTPRDLSKLSHSVLLRTNHTITESGLKKISSGLLPKGTVLLSSRAPIGYIAISDIPVAINQGFIALKCNKVLGKHFVFNWVLSNIPKIKSYANGSTFEEISKKSFRAIKVIYPQPELLNEFENIADCLYKKYVDLVKQNEQLISTRDNLIPKLYSGEIIVGK